MTRPPRPLIVATAAGLSLFAAGLLLWWATALDLGLHHRLLVSAGSPGEVVAAGLSAIGGFSTMGPLALAVAIVLTLRRRSGEALWLAATIAVGRLLVEGVKVIVQRPRPPLGDRLADVTSWSFPSSHSAGTMMTCLAFALLAGGGRPAIAAALALTAAIGWSRAALGVHWPSDVLAGWGFGMAWVGVAMRWLPSTDRYRSS